MIGCRSSKFPWWLVIALVCACGSSSDDDDDDDASGNSGEGFPPIIERFVPAPALAPLAETELSILRDAIADHFDTEPLVSSQHSVLIVDLENGQRLFELDADVARKPASNTKMLTTAAALEVLGPQYRISTRATSTAMVIGGELDGDLYIVGTHDFMWSDRLIPDPARALRDLGAQLAAAGINTISGDVIVTGEFLYDGQTLGDYQASSHRAAAASAVADAFAASGVSVGSVRSEASLEGPPNASVLAEWLSPPLAVGIVPINKSSHNEFADVLSRHIAWVETGVSSYDAWTSVAAEYFSILGTSNQEVELHDGSGLSHDNRLTADTIVSLLDRLMRSPLGYRWQRSLAVAAKDGTLARRLDDESTSGRFEGKTGTLHDTVALSGYLHHPFDGRRYGVAMLANAVANLSATRVAHDGVIAELSSDFRRADVLPAPELVAAYSLDDRTVLEWEPITDAVGYVLWRSDDGVTWDRKAAQLVDDHRVAVAPSGGLEYFRVTAWSGSADGIPSDVYATQPGGRILIVDGNDRWQLEPTFENHLGEGHSFVASYAPALGDYGFDTVSNEAIESGRYSLAGYEAVVWLLGEESDADSTFSPREQGLVASFVASGGKLIVSGSEIGWDLDEMGDGADREFLGDVLGVSYVADDAETLFVHSEMEPNRLVSFFDPGALLVGYPDVFAAPANGQVLLRYDTGGAAAVASGGVVMFGFPLEAIVVDEDREQLLAQSLALLKL